MPHPLDEHALPGIGPMRRARLIEVGVLTLEALLERPPDDLTTLTGFSAGVVERAREAARSLLDSPPPAPLPEVPDLPGSSVPPALRVEPPAPVDDLSPQDVPTHSGASKGLRRGLDTARRIEMTLDAVRRSRAHVKKVEGMPPVRKELKRLRHVLERVQRESITHGLSKRAAEDLDGLLSKLDDRLDTFVSKPPTVKRAFKLLERVQAAERKLAARIG